MTQAVPCWACGKEIDLSDSYCRHCGKGLGQHVPFYYSHFGIIVLTLCALGPLTLWFVWRSPLLSRMAKWVYTVLICAFTWWTVASICRIYDQVMGQLRLMGI